MKRLLVVIIISLCLLPLLAHAELDKKEIDQIRAYADPIANNILDAMKAKDFKRATRDFSENMLAALSPDNFAATVNRDIEPEFGTYVSHAFDHVSVIETHISVYYLAKFTKEKQVLVELAFTQNDPQHKVQGLWLKPAETAKRAGKEEAEAIRKTYEPVINAYFKALKAKDYQALTKNFSPKMLEALKPEKLKEVYENQIAPHFGVFASAQFDRVDFEQNYIAVYYLATYSKGAQLQTKFVFQKGEPEHKIFGLFEKPLNE